MKHSRIRFTLWLIMALVISGCAAKTESRSKVLFPPPPDEPRYEWLGTIASVADFPNKKSGFNEMLVGENTTNLFSGPIGVAATSDGQILVSDIYNRKITALDLASATVSEFSSAGFDNNIGLAVDAQDRVYVADGKAGKVLVFSAAGEPLHTIGNRQELSKPVFLAVNDRLGRLYVSDSLDHTIKVFSLGGELLFQFGGKGGGEGELYAPQGLAIDSDDRLYVADMLNARIQVFSADGEFVNKFGQRGQFDHQFENPKSLAFDSEGNLYVVDSRRPNFRVFSADGTLLLVVGGKTRSHAPLAFAMPSAVFVDGRDRVLITDFLKRTVTVWQFLSATHKAGAAAPGD